MDKVLGVRELPVFPLPVVFVSRNADAAHILKSAIERC